MCSKYQGLIETYKEYLPVSEKTPVVSLLEGKTPLIEAKNLASKIGLKSCKLFLKYDGLNPTGSFKDRGMTMAVSKAVEDGAKAIICASTGNTSASAAAYAAKSGLKCYVLIPDGYIAMGKLSQAMMYGACIIAIDGNFDEALEMVLEISKNYPIQLVNSLNPYRIEGQKTATFEIIEDFHLIVTALVHLLCRQYVGSVWLYCDVVSRMYFSDQNLTLTHFSDFVFQAVFHQVHSHEHGAMFLIHRRQREQDYHRHVVEYRDCDKDKNQLNHLIVLLRL